MSNPYGQTGRMVALARSGSEAAGNAAVPNGRINPRSGSLIAGNEALISQSGDLNASSKRELLQAHATLQRQVQNGTIHRTKPQMFKTAAERQRAADRFVAAWYAKDGNKSMDVIAEVMADEIWTTLGRESFAPKVLAVKELAQGEIGRLLVRDKDVVAYSASSPSSVVPSLVRQFFVFPPEFYITASILIEDKDIAQSPVDILENKYQDGLEQVGKKVDDAFINLARTTASAVNSTFFFNVFTPSVFSEMQIEVAHWGVPAATALVPFDLWNDIRTDSEFASYWDPVSKHEIIMEGSIGSIFGVQLITDAYKHPTLRVLGDGEVYILGAPETMGGMIIRKETSTKTIDKYAQEQPLRGWWIEKLLGISILSPRGIVRAQRI